MNWALFLSTFSLIFFAELPDKTAVATLMMATRGRPLVIFFGVAAAFFVQCLVAVIFGHYLSLLPEHWVHLGAGLLFVLFAVFTWIQKDEDEEISETQVQAGAADKSEGFFGGLWKAFFVIFMAEWGDLTQLATASMAARYRDSLGTVFAASVLALWSVTAVAVVVGHKLRHVVHPRWLKIIATFAFAVVGVYFLVT